MFAANTPERTGNYSHGTSRLHVMFHVALWYFFATPLMAVHRDTVALSQVTLQQKLFKLCAAVWTAYLPLDTGGKGVVISQPPLIQLATLQRALNQVVLAPILGVAVQVADEVRQVPHPLTPVARVRAADVQFPDAAV